MVEREKRIESVFKAIADRIFIVNKDGFFTDFIPSEKVTYLISPEKIVGSSIFDIFPEDEALRHLAFFRETIETGLENIFEYTITDKGKTSFFEAVITKLNDFEVISIVRDITKRVETERALKNSEKRFRDLADLLPEAIFETDKNMILTYANRKGFEFFGYDSDDFNKGINCLDLIIPEEKEKAKVSLLKKYGGEQEKSSEYTGLRKNGTKFPILIHSNIQYTNDEFSGIRGVIIDMTIQKSIDESVYQTQKLESIGLLAGGIAHDFNNLILGLFGSVEIARNELNNGNYNLAKEALNNSMTAFDRAKNLTHQLLTFAKGGIPNKKPGDIAKTVYESAQFALSGSNVVCQFESEKNLPQCCFDPNQIGQVIENIVINAKQAMSDKGIINIKIYSKFIDKTSNELVDPGRYIKVSIEDSGTGIPEKYRKKIFDPFFTTKSGGSGLGLATSWSIIKRHHGMMDLESEVSKGSTFNIYLPVSSGETPSPETEKISVNRVNYGKILIMDDEFLIREIAGKMLTDAGFEIEKAASGEETIELYRKAMEKGKKFDAVILDLTVPGGMGGKETVEELRQIDPDVTAIASSGYSEDAIISNPSEFGFDAAIPKPYLKDVFASMIAEAISAKKLRNKP